MSNTSRDFLGPVPPTWGPEETQPLRCIQVRRETHDVTTFVLAASELRSFRYLPGQFITLELPIGGRTVYRCYTLSSTPTRPDTVSITVKRIAGGGTVSNWLHDHLRVGDTLPALGPSGDFSCFTEPAPKLLFIAGGSGITPLMSMTRALGDLASTTDVLFVQCARTPADLLFADELALWARTLPHLRLAFVCERQDAGSAYAGHLGRIDAGLLARIAPDFADRDTYTCGPAPFMAAVQGALQDLGYAMARYRQESFTFDLLPAAQAASGDAVEVMPSTVVVSGHTITLSKSGHTYRCEAGRSILQAGLQAGLRLPYSCSSGACGTCKCKKLSGSVEMTHAGGIRQREIDQGYILPCCSVPTSDVVLDR